MYDYAYFLIFFSCTENISKISYTNRAQVTVTDCLRQEETENKLWQAWQAWQRLYFCS